MCADGMGSMRTVRSILLLVVLADLAAGQAGQYVPMDTHKEGLAHQLARFGIYSMKNSGPEDKVNKGAIKGFRLAKVTTAREREVSGTVYDVACESKKGAELKMRFFEHLQQGTFQMTGAKLKKSADATAINLLAAREFPFPLDKAKFSPSEFKELSRSDEKEELSRSDKKEEPSRGHKKDKKDEL
mmetsp:Transcript_28187/g.65146  ORF Transcript_28187/g.65146 Transcript_28187/m.65146 type:complete len:186 (-) Transcript_28187:48-605(-)